MDFIVMFSEFIYTKNENSDPCPSFDDINIFSIGPIRPTVMIDVYSPMPVP